MGMRRGKTLLAGAAAAAGMIAVGGLALASDDVDLDADLSGANEVPPADPDGDGKADVEWEINGNEICFDVEFDDIGTPNRGHIHEGAAGINGPIVVTFFELRPPPADPGAPAADPRNDELEEDDGLKDCVPADPAVLARIEANPQNFYVNLHNARFPGGAVRGQLED
jgi:CHRD domain